MPLLITSRRFGQRSWIRRRNLEHGLVVTSTVYGLTSGAAVALSTSRPAVSILTATLAGFGPSLGYFLAQSRHGSLDKAAPRQLGP